MVPVIIILAGAGISLIASWQVYNYYQGQLTSNGLIAYLSFMLIMAAIMIVGGQAGNGAVGGKPAAIARLLLVAFSMLPSLIIMALLVGEYCGRTSIGAMFFPKIHQPAKNRLGRMKSLLWDEDVPAAVRVCMEEFDKYPDDFEILLDGAQLLQDRGSYLESLKLLQRVMDTFYNNETAWSQASYRAASIRMEHLDNKETACMLFRKIADRMPNAEVGMRARERMHGDVYAMKRPEPERPWYQVETGTRPQKELQPDADPFYRKRPPQPMQTTEENDIPITAATALEDEMPGMFMDNDTNKRG
jgi:hypothetical protein